MQAPKMMFYLAEDSISALLEQIEGGALTEISNSNSKEFSQGLNAGAEVGGLFFQILNLGKLSLGTSRDKKLSSSRSGKISLGPYAHLSRVLEHLRPLVGDRYFASLDEAFKLSPENEASWVQVRDCFDLTNVGSDWSMEALERERRFVFEIHPNMDSYDNADEYYKKALRPWSLVMTAGFNNWPRFKNGPPGVSSHEALYFRQFGYTGIPLNVFGSFVKTKLRALIIPFAIWI